MAAAANPFSPPQQACLSAFSMSCLTLVAAFVQGVLATVCVDGVTVVGCVVRYETGGESGYISGPFWF